MKIKNLIPWVIAVFIFVYLFNKYSIKDLWRAASFIHIGYFISYTTAYFFYMWFLDCWNLSWFFTRFGTQTKIREIMPVRFASYLIMIFNFGAGQGMFSYFFKKKKNVPFFRSSSIVLFTIIIDLYWVIFLAFVGSFYADLRIEGVNLTRIIQTMWGGATVALLSLMFFWKLPINWSAIRWIKTRDLFHTFHDAKFSDYGLMMLMRLPMHLAVNTSLYFVALTFNAHIPLWSVIAFSPVVILIGTIPITPGGLGTVQIATVEFFKNYIGGHAIEQGLVSPAELLFAMSLLFVFSNYFLKALTGAIFFKKVASFRHPSLEQEV